MLAVVAARLAQFACAMVLLGAPLFFVYGLPARGPGAAAGLGWPRPFLLGAAVVLALAAAVALSAQTAVMSDSLADAFKPDVVASVVADSQFGLWTAARLGLAVLAGLVLAAARPSRPLWLAVAILGAGVVASFAWTGHGAADEGVAGWLHQGGDVLHLFAAAVWLGALAVLAILLVQTSGAAARDELSVLHAALAGFSGIGSAVVAVLLATGLVNAWFLVGPAHLAEAAVSAYGLLLLAKVALFAAMLGLAAANRFRLTPRLAAAIGAGGPTAAAVADLRRSVLVETSIGVLVLVLVSLLGALAPLSSQ